MLRPHTRAAQARVALFCIAATALLALPAAAQHEPWNPAMSATRHAALFARLFGAPRPGPAAVIDAALERLGGPGAGLDAQDAPVTAADPYGWAVIPPPARWAHSSVYDAVRDRLIVFGGQGYGGTTGEVWALSLSGIPHWTLLLPSGTGPAGLAFHSAVYDSLADRMIVFGGQDANGVPTNAVWSLSFAGNPAWSLLAPTGTPPSPRIWHLAVRDRARNRMLVMGGQSGGTILSDTWALSLTGTPAWTPVAAAGTPPARAAHGGAYDSVNDRLVIFGGLDGTGAATNSVWALSLAGTPTWSPVAALGTPPSARSGASVTYDRLRNRLVVFAGGTGAPNKNDLWTLSLDASPTWAPLSPGNLPEGRQFHGAVYDPLSDKLVVFGGSSGPILSDTWTLALSSPGQWIPLSCTRRWGHLAFYDPARARMDVFGGADNALYNDVWDLPLSAAPNWEKLAPAGTPPSPRTLMAGVYDPRQDRMIVFGGRDVAPRNDTWQLTFSGELAWAQLTPAGAPPSPREDCASAYDSNHGRMVVFGGADSSGTFAEVWTLSLVGAPAWTKLVPSGTAPSARGGSSAIYDPLRDRLVVWGGYDKNFFALDDAYSLSLGGTPTWSKIAATGTLPAARFASAAIYDAPRDRLLVLGGTDFDAFFGDTWGLPLSTATSAWSALSFPGTTPSARSDHRAVYDPVADRLVFFGGENTAGELHDAWSLSFANAPVGVAPGPPPVRLALAAPRPNPARAGDGVTLALDLPAAATGLTLGVYDVRGRRVAELATGAQALGPGTHAFRWDGRLAGGEAAPAGIYFARAAWSGETATRKVVLTR